MLDGTAGSVDSVLSLAAYEATQTAQPDATAPQTSDVVSATTPEVPQQPTVADAGIENVDNTDDLVSKLDVELASIDAKEVETALEEASAEAKTEEDSVAFAKFSEDFQTYMGIPLKEAMAQYESTVESARQLTEQAIIAQHSVQLNMAKFDLMHHWRSEVPDGVSPSTFVDQRLEQLRTANSKLPEATQKKLAANGVQGILALWKHVGKSQTQQKALTSQTSTNSASKAEFTEAEIMSWPPDKYEAVGRKPLMTGQYIK